MGSWGRWGRGEDIQLLSLVVNVCKNKLLAPDRLKRYLHPQGQDLDMWYSGPVRGEGAFSYSSDRLVLMALRSLELGVTYSRVHGTVPCILKNCQKSPF